MPSAVHLPAHNPRHFAWAVVRLVVVGKDVSDAAYVGRIGTSTFFPRPRHTEWIIRTKLAACRIIDGRRIGKDSIAQSKSNLDGEIGFVHSWNGKEMRLKRGRENR